MSQIISLTFVIVCAFLLGSVPFFYLYFNWIKGENLRLVHQDRYPMAQVVQLSRFNLPSMVVLCGVDLLKGVFAILIADQLLGQSDFSLAIASFSCLSGSLMFQLVFKRNLISPLCILGVFLWLNPILTVFVLLVSLGLYFIVSNLKTIEFIFAGTMFVLLLITDNPLSFVAYSVFVLMYLGLLEYDFLRKIMDRFV